MDGRVRRVEVKWKIQKNPFQISTDHFGVPQKIDIVKVYE